MADRTGQADEHSSEKLEERLRRPTRRTGRAGQQFVQLWLLDRVGTWIFQHGVKAGMGMGTSPRRTLHRLFSRFWAWDKGTGS